MDIALRQANPCVEDVIRCYRRYISFVAGEPPTYKQFIRNMEEKMQDSDFLDDSQMLLRPDLHFDAVEAYALVKERLIDRLQ